MIYLELFWVFFKISIVTFGGGYAMMPLIIQETTERGFLTENQVFQFIGISESTPGPFAINIATFAGFEVAGVLGALVATFAVILPSFIIIMTIAIVSSKVINKPIVQTVLNVLKPAIIGFILAAAISVTAKSIIGDPQKLNISWQAIVIFLTMATLSSIFKKKFPPILLILLSGLMGLGLYLI